MKKLVLIAGLCVTVMGALVLYYRWSKNTSWPVVSRQVLTEYAPQASSELTFLPRSLFVYRNELYALNASDRSLHVYSPQLVAQRTIPLPAAGLQNIVNVSVAGDTLYLADARNNLLAWHLGTGQHAARSLGHVRFTRMLVLNGNRYLLKGQDTEHGDRANDVFKIYDPLLRRVTVRHASVLEKLEDGGLNTDGFMVKDARSGEAYYVSYLNSKVYAFDAAGQYRGLIRTVGNVDKVYKTREINGMITYAEPTPLLNRVAYADQGLYVYSDVPSADPRKYGTEALIDRYELGQQYTGSIRLRKLTSHMIANLISLGNSLVVGEGNRLVLYSPAA